MPGGKLIQKKLRTERKLRHWSQVELARKIGVNTRTVQRWEAGDTKPYGYYLQQLTMLFSVTSPTSRLFSSPDELRDDAPPTATLPPVDAAFPLPPIGQLLEREEPLRFLRSHVCDPCHIALYGLPGVGKTALVRAVVHDPALRNHFDGILWASLGPRPELFPHLKRWGRVLGLRVRALTCEKIALALRSAIGHRRMLLVLDDVWDWKDALALSVGGPNCSYILTTRFPRLAARFTPTMLHIEELSEDASRSLLSDLAPLALAPEPQLGDQLLATLGGLPLAIRLVANYLREQSFDTNPRRIGDAWQHVLQPRERLHLREPFPPGERRPGVKQSSLGGLIESVFKQLEDAPQRALSSLTVLPSGPATFSEQAALAVLDGHPECLDQLVDMGLLRWIDSRYRLHPVIRDYARLRHRDDAAPQRLVFYLQKVVLRRPLDPSLLLQEYDTIRAAVEIARTIGQEDLVLRELGGAIASLFSSKQERQRAQGVEIKKALDILVPIFEEGKRDVV